MRVGLYCGTFNPFHKGHLNIWRKAKEIFDRVIVCRGINPDKGKPQGEFILQGIKTKDYEGLTTDLIKNWEKCHDVANVTLIRGIRSGYDYEYEMNQINLMRRFHPDMNVVLIPCDREFNDISSSAIRALQSISAHDEANLLLP